MSETPENLPPGLMAIQVGVQLHANMEAALDAASGSRSGAVLEVLRGPGGAPQAALLHVAGIHPQMAHILLSTFAEMLESVQSLHAPDCDCEEELGAPAQQLPEHRLTHDESGSPACSCGYTPDREDRANGNGLGAVAIHIAVAGMQE